MEDWIDLALQKSRPLVRRGAKDLKIILNLPFFSRPIDQKNFYTNFVWQGITADPQVAWYLLKSSLFYVYEDFDIIMPHQVFEGDDFKLFVKGVEKSWKSFMKGNTLDCNIRSTDFDDPFWHKDYGLYLEEAFSQTQTNPAQTKLTYSSAPWKELGQVLSGYFKSWAISLETIQYFVLQNQSLPDTNYLRTGHSAQVLAFQKALDTVNKTRHFYTSSGLPTTLDRISKQLLRDIEDYNPEGSIGCYVKYYQEESSPCVYVTILEGLDLREQFPVYLEVSAGIISYCSKL
jgi:hypothetical protein